MGCDIHLYKEKQINGKWVAADEWVDGDDGQEVDWRKQFHGRNYKLFGLLCRGVRTEHALSFKARGMPTDACPEVAGKAAQWDCDGHNHSYLYVHELRSLLETLKVSTTKIEGMKDRDELAALNASISSGTPDWSLLYPYCGSTNNGAYVEFSIDVPASFIIGGSIEDIISGFDGIEGDNQRIVFWFDN